MIVSDLTTVRKILDEARTIAILGAHRSPVRAAYYVPEYLQQQGYRVIPVNPTLVGRTLWGEPVLGALTEIDVPVDIVDVFRRRDHLAAHVPEILAMSPLPKVVWFQLGIWNDGVAEELAAAGIDVVQDRCTFADHKHLGLGAVR
ncbi:MAG: CoA-binding protein [Deltaproteobacteria bacterium]|nr:MAG: CoA-binding protein [Deltaproteobacteria bacterium]